MDPSQIPFAPNPNGDPPNFADETSLKPFVLGTGVTFITISALLVVLRLFTGLKKSRRLFADDWFCVVGEVVGIAQWAVLYTLMSKGLSKHSWNVPVTTLTVQVMQLQLANQMLAAVTHFAVKASLVFFFLRLFGTLSWVRATGYLVLILTFLSYFSYEVIVLVFCVPRSGEAWDSVILARCATSAPATIAVGVCSVVADLVLFILPFPIIAGLTLSREKKRGLVLVFLLGLLVLITSVVGLAYRVIVSYSTDDPVWHGGNVAITAYMEVFGTVIVACTPSLPGLWNGILTKTSFYSSLRSRILGGGSRSRSSRRTHLGGGGSGASHRDCDSDGFGLNGTKHSYPPPTFRYAADGNDSQYCYYYKTSFQAGSQRELVQPQPQFQEGEGGADGLQVADSGFSLQSIQKTTTFRVSSAHAAELDGRTQLK